MTSSRPGVHERLGGADGRLIPSAPYRGDGVLGGIREDEVFHDLAGVLDRAGDLDVLLGDQGDVGVILDHVVERLAALHNARMRTVGQRDDGALAAHQVLKEVFGDQLAHRVVVAGGVDHHALHVAAVAAEDGHARVKGGLELGGDLSGVAAHDDDRVRLGGDAVLDAAGQLAEVALGVDEGDLHALLLHAGLHHLAHLVGGHRAEVGGEDGDFLAGGAGRGGSAASPLSAGAAWDSGAGVEDGSAEPPPCRPGRAPGCLPRELPIAFSFHFLLY